MLLLCSISPVFCPSAYHSATGHVWLGQVSHRTLGMRISRGSIPSVTARPRLQEKMQATLLYAPTLYCCCARCRVLPGPGRGGPDELPTLCGQAKLRGPAPRFGGGRRALWEGVGPTLGGAHGPVHSPSLSSHLPWAPGRTHP